MTILNVLYAHPNNHPPNSPLKPSTRTDAAILYVPMPLLWTLRVPLRQKLVIGLLLSSGVFVISAAIIRVVSTLVANPSALTINRWGVRETIVGIIAVNAPISPPLFRKSFWRKGKVAHGSGGLIAPAPRHRAPLAGPYQIPTTIGGTDYATTTTAVTTQPCSGFHGSQDNIIVRDEEKDGEENRVQGDVVRQGLDGQVLVETTFEVTTEFVGEAQEHDTPRRSARAFAELRPSQDECSRHSMNQEQ